MKQNVRTILKKRRKRKKVLDGSACVPGCWCVCANTFRLVVQARVCVFVCEEVAHTCVYVYNQMGRVSFPAADRHRAAQSAIEGCLERRGRPPRKRSPVESS